MRFRQSWWKHLESILFATISIAWSQNSVIGATKPPPSIPIIRGGDIVNTSTCIIASRLNNTATSMNLMGGGGMFGIAGSSDILSRRGGKLQDEVMSFSEAAPMGRARSRLMASIGSKSDKKQQQTNVYLKGGEGVAEIDEMTTATSEEEAREIRTMGGPLKVLFLSSDTGGGHRASAEALAKHFQMYYPGTTYDLLDVWTMDGCYPYRTLVPTYKHLSAHPRQWKFLYHLSNTLPYMLFMDTHSTWTCERKIRRRIASHDPDVIVSVHPTMNNVPLISTKKIRKKLDKNIPFFTVCTDFGSGHATWFNAKDVDKIFVASDRIRKLAKRRGRIADASIIQSGLPIRHDFAKEAQNMKEGRRSSYGLAYQLEMRERLKIPHPNRKMVLLMGGGEGVGSLSAQVNALYTTFANQGIDATIAVVCGRNENLKKDLETRDFDKVLEKETRLKKRRHLHKIRWAVPSKRIRDSLSRAAQNAKNGKLNPDHVKGSVDVVGLGFVSNMAEFMVAADVLITKAGPGTIAEAAALGLPVMITSFLPGQEAGNVNIVLDNGFGDYCNDAFSIAEEVACWLQDEELLDIMSQNAMNIGMPDAASDIVIEIGETTHRCMELNRKK